uniref:Uncharacterized protein n=1 Tax=Anopheles culicifacies TaxID=139723 RepID=A0A182LRK8_9DIPT
MAICGCGIMIILGFTVIACCYVLLRAIAHATTRETPDPTPPMFPVRPLPFLPRNLSPRASSGRRLSRRSNAPPARTARSPLASALGMENVAVVEGAEQDGSQHLMKAGHSFHTISGPPVLAPPLVELISPISRSQSPVSLRSWSVSISTATSDEIEYDNYTDDDEDDDYGDGSDVSGASPRRPKQYPVLSASPFDFGSIAAPVRPKGTKVSSTGRKAGGGKRGKSAGTERASSTSPAGSSSTNAPGSTVIRLVPASVDIFQTLLDL